MHLELDVCKDQHVIISFWSQVFHFKWPVPALFPTRPLDSLLRLQNSSKLKLSTHRPIPWVPMQQPDIVNFSVFISVALLYMDMPQPEPRVRAFETVIGALKPLLEACGRPPFLKAAFEVWASMSNSLVVLEKLHFPDLPPETPTSLVLPPRPQPLGALLNQRFREHRGKFGPALAALNEFLDWFRLHYDTDLHSDTYSMLQDTMLLLQSCQTLIELARDEPAPAPVPTALAAGPASREAAAPPSDPNQPCMVLLPNEY